MPFAFLVIYVRMFEFRIGRVMPHVSGASIHFICVIYHADIKISNMISDNFGFFLSAIRLAGQGGIMYAIRQTA